MTPERESPSRACRATGAFKLLQILQEEASETSGSGSLSDRLRVGLELTAMSRGLLVVGEQGIRKVRAVQHPGPHRDRQVTR